MCEPASLDTQISFSFDEIMTVFVRKKGYGVDLTTWLAISAILNQLSTKWVKIHSVGVIFALFTSADQWYFVTKIVLIYCEKKLF